MIKSEAEKVAYVLGLADDARPDAVRDLVDAINRADLGWHFSATGEIVMEPMPGVDPGENVKLPRVIVLVALD